jgi:uncharacterized protein YndB with AHSA1/START domain
VRVQATAELLAPREDVWAFLEEPRHLADWWPGIAAVEPDRRGLAPGARWQVRRPPQPSLFRRAGAQDLVLVRRVERPVLVEWHLTAGRLDVELRLEETRLDRTRATLAVERAVLLGPVRELPRRALARLHALVQTAASL